MYLLFVFDLFLNLFAESTSVMLIFLLCMYDTHGQEVRTMIYDMYI